MNDPIPQLRLAALVLLVGCGGGGGVLIEGTLDDVTVRERGDGMLHYGDFSEIVVNRAESRYKPNTAEIVLQHPSSPHLASTFEVADIFLRDGDGDVIPAADPYPPGGLAGGVLYYDAYYTGMEVNRGNKEWPVTFHGEIHRTGDIGYVADLTFTASQSCIDNASSLTTDGPFLCGGYEDVADDVNRNEGIRISRSIGTCPGDFVDRYLPGIDAQAYTAVAYEGGEVTVGGGEPIPCWKAGESRLFCGVVEDVDGWQVGVYGGVTHLMLSGRSADGETCMAELRAGGVD